MNKRLQFFETEPIIAAVKTEEQLERALTSGSNIIFFLFGNICNIPKLVESVKERGKYAFVHLDLIELVPGLMPKIIRQVHSLHRTPLIAGGLIRDKEDTVSALFGRGGQHQHLLRGGLAGAGFSADAGAKTIQEGRDVRR